MRIYRQLDQVPKAALRHPAVTIGVFDGVHRGHQRLLEALVRAAAARRGDAVVVTFDQHPRCVVGRGAPPVITSLSHRLLLFERFGVDVALVLPFDRELASVSAEQFVRRVLLGALGAEVVVLGRDAHFGRGREGGIELLERLGPQLGFELVACDLLSEEGAGGTVSSTAIRQAVAAGDLERARSMLGRPVALLGRVVRGDERGRTLGFPTANLELHQEVCPPHGVYAGRVEIDGVRFPTVQNLGVRPTIGGGGRPGEATLEVHVIGYEGNLYGRVLEVELCERLRDERRFPDLDALTRQLGEDRLRALAVARA